MYINLIKSINVQVQNSLTNSISDSTSTDEQIKSNNQFLMELNSILRSNQSNISVLNQQPLTVNTNEINWFQLLTKICVFKSNQILDCLLFSVFKKISQLTPPLFAFLLGPYNNKFHKTILEKLKTNKDGQILTILSEFLCSIIKYQPVYFQKLACLSTQSSNGSSTQEKFIEGENSVLKGLFDLLSKIKTQDKVSCSFFNIN